MSTTEGSETPVLDLQVRKLSAAVTAQFENAIGHLDGAQAPFADLLDRMDELDLSYGDDDGKDGDGATVVKLLDEATANLRKAAELVRAMGASQ